MDEPPSSRDTYANASASDFGVVAAATAVSPSVPQDYAGTPSVQPHETAAPFDNQNGNLSLQMEEQATLVPVPRLSSQAAKAQRIHQTGKDDCENEQQHNNGDNSEEDDISEGECEAQMRHIRRSLSIERRFEQLEEEQRPRLLLRPDSDTSNAQSGQKYNAVPQDAIREAEMSEWTPRRPGWSYTAAADAWDE
jgi:hypothetical protein